jgi:hypothetical protein
MSAHLSTDTELFDSDGGREEGSDRPSMPSDIYALAFRIWEVLAFCLASLSDPEANMLSATVQLFTLQTPYFNTCNDVFVILKVYAGERPAGKPYACPGVGFSEKLTVLDFPGVPSSASLNELKYLTFARSQAVDDCQRQAKAER